MTAQRDPQPDDFTAVVIPLRPNLERYANRLTRDPAEAEDLVSESMVRALKAWPRFDGAHPRAWLFTIVRNLFFNSRRRDVARHHAHTMAGADTWPAEALDEQYEAEVERARAVVQVHELLEQIPPKFARVVRLVDLDGASYKDAAAVLDVPIGTIMSRLYRGRQAMRVAAEPAPQLSLFGGGRG